MGYCLVGGWALWALWKMMEWSSVGMIFHSQYMESHKSHVPNHQSDYNWRMLKKGNHPIGESSIHFPIKLYHQSITWELSNGHLHRGQTISIMGCQWGGSASCSLSCKCCCCCLVIRSSRCWLSICAENLEAKRIQFYGYSTSQTKSLSSWILLG